MKTLIRAKKSIELLILSDTPIKKTSTVGMIYSWFWKLYRTPATPHIRYRGAHSHYASLHAHDALSRYRLFAICADLWASSHRPNCSIRHRS